MLSPSPTQTVADSSRFERLRMLSFNIQVGIDMGGFSDYLKKSWRHVLPHSGRHINLAKIAELVKNYDVVALQEVDAGSLRSSFINQVEYIAEHAGFPHWHVQRNRNLASIAAHANGLLSKLPAELVVDHSLPGLIPGRGALQVSFGSGDQSLVVVVAHLALSRKAQIKQIEYIAESVREHPYFVIMGDMNCEPAWLHAELKKFNINTQLVAYPQPTYPSWNPRRSIDQILISDNLEVAEFRVLPEIISDHLPVAMDIMLPKKLASHLEACNHQEPTSTQNY
ncbi:endonuclease/exonuclease/phosphatase family protein [Pleionea sediminis]|uniref:endonuclease/exonuclease/phosphatase family protein n=1 Tax=Pleionea sediminis TaxID=2569479 RepID=UPI0011846BBA|nr:endonuclease/exonuclease/phosphatase family protein [Pleionea sediminis]